MSPEAVGCEKIFQEKVSGVSDARPEWDRLMEHLRPGDTLVVTELSGMIRSLMHLLQLSNQFVDKGINIRSLRENIDKRTATGRAFIALMGVINELERELKAERAAAGRTSAKARGRTGGRPKKDAKKLHQAAILYHRSDYTVDEVCKLAVS